MKAEDLEQMIKDRIMQIVERDNNDKQDEIPADTFYPHEAGQCPRLLYFRRVLGRRKVEDERTKRVFYLGRLLHEVIEKEIVANFSLPEEEREKIVKEWKNIKVKGIADIVADDWIGEIKTTAQNISFLDEPRPEHVAQLQLYLWLYGKEKGYIIYISRNDLHTRVFEVKKDITMIWQILEKYARIYEHIQRREAPERQESYICEKCQYIQECQMEERRRRKWL